MGAMTTAASAKTLLLLATEDWFVVSHWLPLIRAARESGYRVVVVCSVGEERQVIEGAGAEVVHVAIRRDGRQIVTEILLVLALIRIYRQARPDLAHHIALKPMLYGSLASVVARVPAVVNALTGAGVLAGRRSLLRGALRLGLWVTGRLSLATFLVENAEDADLVRRLGLCDPGRIALIPGAGVDVQRFRPAVGQGTKLMVLCPARMLRTKGIEEFVEAARRVRLTRADVRFVLAGRVDPANPDAIDEPTLREWMRQGAVEWWGHVERMETALAQATLVCLPSYREGLPKSLTEAAACGLPVITTDVPGCREVVVGGETGVLVPARDAATLADAIAGLLDDPEQRDRMGRAARERAVRLYGEEAVRQRFKEVWREVERVTNRPTPDNTPKESQ